MSEKLRELTICWSDEQVVHEGGGASDDDRSEKIEALILKIQVYFQVLIGKEVRGMGRDATTCHDRRAFPKAQESLLFIQNSGRLPHRDSLSASLPASLQGAWLGEQL